MPSFDQQLIDALPHLRAFARSLTPDRALADDLAQEAATRALANRRSYRPGSNFRAWVFTILRNAFYSEHRRKWRTSEQTDEAAMLAHGEPGRQQAHLELDDFRRTFGCLPAEQREALVLVGACGFGIEQAAEVAGCAPGTVKSRVSRGRRELKARLDGDAVVAPSRVAASAPGRGGRRRSEDGSEDVGHLIDHLISDVIGHAGGRSPERQPGLAAE
ncbi:sigma-70 family RNA polymerase sigma factor [Roseospirillum parvum]|uniref:RNA polymerase sigma-70 factor, ECF subfamily n=1 Tax=Roseospirillum parvum TaxID=83401 RepID=A0A1G8AKB0_9PROT|nr:sigma-70 family RNA polymerase sigma factor [Roseospirillum parvum]SDH21358.1 RNA polymerase sigma-70 factor, ECF subfamily [Roseospirillum parvum]